MVSPRCLWSRSSHHGYHCFSSSCCCSASQKQGFPRGIEIPSHLWRIWLCSFPTSVKHVCSRGRIYSLGRALSGACSNVQGPSATLWLLSRPLVTSATLETGNSLSCYVISGQTLEQAAQGDGWVPIPGGVQKTCRCGTLGYALAFIVVLGGWLDLMILEIFSNRWFYDTDLFLKCIKWSNYL